MMLYCVLFVCLCASQVLCLNFNVKKVTRVSLERNDTYFGYSILLQRGRKPLLIVGAPKDDPVKGGGLYSCSLDNSCKKYSNINTNNKDTFTSNFLGSALDGSDIAGEEIIVCSPRRVIYSGQADNTFQKGLCFYHRNSTIFTSEQTLQVNPLTREEFTHYQGKYSYYDYGFAEAGLSVHHMKNKKMVLLGAPGVKKWSGSVVVQSLEDLSVLSQGARYSVLPKRFELKENEAHGYLGYSVSSGYFRDSSGSPQIVIGGPRANNLQGLVHIFNGEQIANSYTSDEIGSYYGSIVLAEDVDNDGRDDIFVGAPFGSGSTYNEGYVYFYGVNFSKQYKLLGSQKTGALFGSAIVSLGDIDYDSYKDIAISAPNEDDGVGAVYIYMGSKTGIKQTHSQKLSPLLFNGGSRSTRGFGMGLSRGNDLDENGYNDLAVGAYKSGEVFLFNGLSIIDFKLTLSSNVPSVMNGDSLRIRYCMYYTERSTKVGQRSADFTITLQLDPRTDGINYFKTNVTVPLDTQLCKETDVEIVDVVDISPYKLWVKAECLSNIIAVGNGLVEKSIPYAHGCGDDNFCQTEITLTATTKTEEIFVAKDKEVNVSITAHNTGEPGFQCRLIINVPSEIELGQNSLCTFVNESYSCPFASNLTNTKVNNYKFDASRLSPASEHVEIDFEITCLGENLADGKTKASFKISLLNSPFIEGKTDQEKIYFQRTAPEDFEVTHSFSVGNGGPSPVKLDVFLLIPVVRYQNKDVFQFSKATYNDLKDECVPTNESESYQRTFDTQLLVKEPLNETVVYDSFTEGVEHIKLFCPGDYLKKTSLIAKYEVTFTVKTEIISEMYKNGILKENRMAYITSAFLLNSTQKIEGHCVTTVQSTGEETTYLWIYILVGVIVGIILLGLLIYLLYRCHFFDRSLRDKMNDDALVNENNEPTNEDNTNTDDEENGGASFQSNSGNHKDDC